MTASAIILETCRGVKPGGCPHGLPLPLDALAELARPVRRHEQLRLAVSACPNGCVRPQVADLGLIAVQSVTVNAAVCVGCTVCRETCPDAAVSLCDGKAAISAAACLGCGLCAKVCPVRAITTGEVGFRAFLGGRLGRRPRLGLEIGRILSPDEALTLARRVSTAYARQMRPGLRFGDILSPGGLPGLPAWVLA
ncbi:indolepyruvate ferredoxin oxidoreductase subunit alpha [Solidesulfovibrio sp.]